MGPHALGLAKPLIGDPADVPELQTAADHRESSSARRLDRFGLTEDRVDKILVGAKTWLQGV
jgi:hypothetical protein